MTKQNIKRWIASTLMTFFAGFALAVAPSLQDLTLQSFQGGALMGIAFTGIRQGIKLVLEAYLLWYSNKK